MYKLETCIYRIYIGYWPSLWYLQTCDIYWKAWPKCKLVKKWRENNMLNVILWNQPYHPGGFVVRYPIKGLQHACTVWRKNIEGVCLKDEEPGSSFYLRFIGAGQYVVKLTGKWGEYLPLWLIANLKWNLGLKWNSCVWKTVSKGVGKPAGFLLDGGGLVERLGVYDVLNDLYSRLELDLIKTFFPCSLKLFWDEQYASIWVWGNTVMKYFFLKDWTGLYLE